MMRLRQQAQREKGKRMADEQELAARITKALTIARDDVYDGDHHKMWAIDQIVRALTGCQMVTLTAKDYQGADYSYEAQGESDEYLEFVDQAGGWDEGIAP
jgi:hypothetical protein